MINFISPSVRQLPRRLPRRRDAPGDVHLRVHAEHHGHRAGQEEAHCVPAQGGVGEQVRRVGN